MRYPIVVHKDPDSDYSVTVPSLPGCFSAGETMADALDEATEAIECHIEGLLIDNDPIPMPQEIELYKDDPDYADGTWAIVSVDLTRLSGKAKRVNITLPERILSAIDAHADKQGESRSGLLAEAALAYIYTDVSR